VGRIGVTTSRLISPWNRDISLRIMAKAIPWVSLSRYLARAMRDDEGEAGNEGEGPKEDSEGQQSICHFDAFLFINY